MVPLAVSGSIIVAVCVTLAAVAMYWLLRREDRFQEQDRKAEEQSAAAHEHEQDGPLP